MRVRIEMDGSRIGTKVYNAADGQEVIVAALAVVHDFRCRPGEPLATLVVMGAGAAPDVRLAEVAALEADVEADEPTARAMFEAIQSTPQTALAALEDLLGVVAGLLANGTVWGAFTNPEGQAYRARIETVLARANRARNDALAEAARLERVGYKVTRELVPLDPIDRAFFGYPVSPDALAREAEAARARRRLDAEDAARVAVFSMSNNAVALNGGEPVSIPPGTYTLKQLEAKVEELRQAARSIDPAEIVLSLDGRPLAEAVAMAEPEEKEPGA